ncbi:hypothetical protein [Microtetraspora fusca]|uniref:Uncharacterized protein n=1 Tax=Microtetraspora fusca TaxID=1997 RepID=A0ABW6VHV0_MICFU|nr:hypothetical protein [Microtetraspora fusca]
MYELSILFGLAWEGVAPLLLGVGLVVAAVGVTGALIIVLYAVADALVRRFVGRRGLQLRDAHEEQGFVTEWLR